MIDDLYQIEYIVGQTCPAPQPIVSLCCLKVIEELPDFEEIVYTGIFLCLLLFYYYIICLLKKKRFLDA